MRESVIERDLRTRVDGAGGWCLKFICPTAAGVPDRIILLPGGRILFVETKAPDKDATTRQGWVHRKLRDLGFHVAVIDSHQALESWLCEHAIN